MVGNRQLRSVRDSLHPRNLTGGEWQPQSTALAAGGLGTLVQLLFGVMGLLIPAGALGYLGSVGADLVSNKLGGGIATSILVVVVGVVVVGAILPQIIAPVGYLLRRYGRQPLLHLLRRAGEDCGNHQQLLWHRPDSRCYRHRHDDLEGARLRRQQRLRLTQDFRNGLEKRTPARKGGGFPCFVQGAKHARYLRSGVRLRNGCIISAFLYCQSTSVNWIKLRDEHRNSSSSMLIILPRAKVI